MRKLDAAAKVRRERFEPKSSLPGSDASGGVGDRPRRGPEICPRIWCAGLSRCGSDEGFARGDEVVSLIGIHSFVEGLACRRGVEGLDCPPEADGEQTNNAERGKPEAGARQRFRVYLFVQLRGANGGI